MEFFNNATAVRLKGHLDKYLVADDDQETVRQSRNGVSKKARWTVEKVDGNPHIIRLKSCHGWYLAASDEAFLLGLTGKKVVQSFPESKRDGSVEWEPIKEGFRVKFRTKGGKFLRANGATPPWRNSVTHDLPHRTATQDWVMWDVNVVDVSGLDDEQYLPSNASSFSSIRDDDDSCPNSPVVMSERRLSTPVDRLRRSSLRRNGGRLLAPTDLLLATAADSYRLHTSFEGMEFFSKAKAVRLQSHLGKYLVADEDELTVRQSRNGASHRARWTVEYVDGKRNKIRLKSCHGLYLTASEEAFLLGMTGKKVLHTSPEKKTDVAIEWEPVKEGLNVKLMTSEGKFLRANGGAPPWRNSVTHDVPHRTATQSWVLWGVDIVEISDSDPNLDCLSPRSSFSSVADDFSGSPMVQYTPSRFGNMSTKQASGMDFFKKAKSVRLKSHHNKYLTADSDEEKVIQDRSGTSKSVKWEVEFVEGAESVVRLKSCYEKYLKATDEEYLLGVTGRKVVQSLPRKLDSSVEWEPIRDGMLVKLKTRYGNFLRANGGLPPWRNSITHDIPHRHHDWVLWEVDVVEIQPDSPPKISRSESLDDDEWESKSFRLRVPTHVRRGSSEDSTKKSEGRQIYYYVADENGNFNEAIEEASFVFKGHGLEDLSQRLEEETGLEDIIVCSRNIVNGKLFPLRLSLPPNNATMHVVVVPPDSAVAKDFLPPTPTSA